ncbi:MAG: hypothetical protein ACSHXL_06775 [Bacteroidota bacterium]
MRSPSNITDDTRSFARQLSQEGQVIEITCQPHRGAIVNECFDTVSNYVEHNGGERVLGWFIGEWPNAFLLAELHAVWRSDDGEWLDVSRHPIQQRRILFVPDSSSVVPEIQQENQFHPLSDNQVVASYIDSERKAHLAADPNSKYMNPEDPKVIEAQFQLMKDKVSLARLFGWPRGTPMKERVLSKSLSWIS